MWRFWSRRGHLAEGGKWIRQTLDKTGEAADAKLRATAYYGIGALSMNQGDLKAAVSYGEEGLRIARASNDQETIVRALNVLGLAKENIGDYTAAQALYEEGLAVARAAGNKQLIAVLAGNLGTVAHALEDYEAARKYYEEAYTIAKAESIFPALANQASNLAETSCLREDYEAARAYALEALDVSEKLGDRILIAHALDKLGAVALAAGEPEKAARLWGAAQAIFESKGFKIEITEQRFLDRYEAYARAAIGDAAFRAAYREGQSIRLKKAIALARESD